MNIAIVGAGATGLLLSAYYTKLGHDITCYVKREQQKDALISNGLHLIPHQTTTNVKVDFLSNVQDHDLFILCVKQSHLLTVLNAIRTKISNSIPILFLQNGMSHIKLANTLEQPIFVGVLDHGARRINDYTVEHTGVGTIRVGALRQKDKVLLETYAKGLASIEFPFIVEHDWKRILEEKVVVNAVINPLTAIFNVNNGEIISNMHLNFLAKQLCKESCEVLGLNLNLMWKYVLRVAEKTKDNISSMRNDLLQKKPTEIDSISGYILNEAKIKTPFTQFAYHAIKSRELERED